MWDSIEGLDAKRTKLQQKVRKLTIEEEKKLQELRKNIDVDVKIIKLTMQNQDPWSAKILRYKTKIVDLMSLYHKIMRIPGNQAAEQTFIALQEIYKGLLTPQVARFKDSSELEQCLDEALAKERIAERALDTTISNLDRSVA